MKDIYKLKLTDGSKDGTNIEVHSENGVCTGLLINGVDTAIDVKGFKVTKKWNDRLVGAGFTKETK